MEEKDTVVENLEELVEEKEQDLEQSEEDVFEQKVHEIDVRMQELIITLEQIEEKALIEDDQEKYQDEYQKYLDEYDELKKQRKQMIKDYKTNHKSVLEEVSLWVIIYGLLSCVISLPFISWEIWFSVFDLIASNIPGIDNIFYVVRILEIFSVPLVLNLVTWMLFNNIKMNKPTKKLYVVFWILQGLMSLGMMIYCSVLLFEVL